MAKGFQEANMSYSNVGRNGLNVFSYMETLNDNTERS